MIKMGFLGGGKMAQALAKGFIAAGLTKGENILASCAPQDFQSAEAFQGLGAKTTSENRLVAEHAEIVLVAVKPDVVPTVLSEASSAVTSNSLILSVAMGVTVKKLESYLPSGTKVMRVMPSTPALVRQGASVFVCGSTIQDQDVKVTKQLLSSVGTCEQVPEDLLDAITALSGSGPAYIYVLIEALGDGAVRMGLPRDLAYRLAAQTVIGAGQMVLNTAQHPGILKDNVTSPGGSTAAGLYELEKSGMRAAVIGALEAATNKCREFN